MVRERQEKYEVDDKTHKGDSEKVCLNFAVATANISFQVSLPVD